MKTLIGKPYSGPVANARGRVIRLYRGPGHWCRYYDRRARQIGPEHQNVVPAVAWAIDNGFVCKPPPEKKKRDGREELRDLRRAAKTALRALENMTSEQFARGADRPAREALAKALRVSL